jgi:hypothetical protein
VEAGFEVFGISASGPFVPQLEALGVRHVAVPSLTRAWDVRRDAAAARELLSTLRRLRLESSTRTPRRPAFSVGYSAVPPASPSS